jgi:hypothetical protein
MGKCAYCGKHFEGSYSFCSTKCGVEYNEKKAEGKIDDSSGEWWLLSIIFKNWKIVLIFCIVVYVIDFFSGSKKSDNSVYETKDTTNTSTNTDISEKISEPEPKPVKEVTESEIIKDLKENRIANILDGSRNLKYEVLKGDLNKDGNLDYIVTYCIEATDDDRDVGGGNALANMTCVNEGMVAYLIYLTPNARLTTLHCDNDYFSRLKESLKSGTTSFKINNINSDGTITCNTVAYKDDDARCCPSDEADIQMKLILNSNGTYNFQKVQ